MIIVSPGLLSAMALAIAFGDGRTVMTLAVTDEKCNSQKGIKNKENKNK